MNKHKKVIVIGGGFGGLSAACFLAKNGFEVTLFEKNKLVGGRANLYEDKGFRFDTGPSWYLMPDVFKKFFQDFGLSVDKELELVKLSPSYKFYFADMDQITITGSNKDKETFERLEPGSWQNFQKYLKISEYTYKTSMKYFVYRNYRNWMDMFNWEVLRNGYKLRLWQTMDMFVSGFFSSKKVQQMIQYSLVFLGGGPKNTPAIYNLMSYIDYRQGVFYPRGGIYSVVDRITKLAKELGVNIMTESAVDEIVTKDGLAIGVKVNKRFEEADIIVSNADMQFSEMKLLKQSERSYDNNYWSKKVLAPSAFMILLGVNKKLAGLEHHNIFIGDDWDKHFEQIFDKPKMPDDPSYYVCMPSKTDAVVAPRNKENIFILVPIAPGLVLDRSEKKKYRDKIIKDFEIKIGQSFSKDIIVEKIIEVADFKSMFNAYKGTALGLSHALFQTALFRPGNKSKKVSNLYFTGAYTIPGIGMPMCLISGQLVAERIMDDQK